MPIFFSLGNPKNGPPHFSWLHSKLVRQLWHAYYANGKFLFYAFTYTLSFGLVAVAHVLGLLRLLTVSQHNHPTVFTESTPKPNDNFLISCINMSFGLFLC